jgi:DNA replication protein DnaC
MGKNISSFDFSLLNEDLDLEGGGFREVNEECSIVVEEEHLLACGSLNLDKKAIFEEIMRHMNENRGAVFFIDGPSGTGKSFLYKALLSEVCS